MRASYVRLRQVTRIPGPSRRSNLSPADLRSHLDSALPEPLVLTGLIDQWPALKHWRLDHGLGKLRSNSAEDNFVDIELSEKRRSYMDKNYKKITMPLGEY